LKFREFTLDNGLSIVAECNDKAYSMATGFFVNAGARDENDQIAGVSHFLEHMTFKGTPNRSAADVNRELDEIGSQSNAYTSEEQTVYYCAVVPDYQRPAVALLADIMRPSLRDDDFEVEKKVIIEEICKYDDQPPYNAHEKCMNLYFGDHPLGMSVLGTAETVSALTPDAMREYFKRRYSPSNMTLVASGNVDFESLVETAQQLCGEWEPFDAQRADVAAAGVPGIRWMHRPNANQQYVIQVSGGPHATDDDRYAQRLMSVIFGDDGGSRLFWEFVDTGQAEYASTASYEFQDAGLLMSFLSCAPEDALANAARLGELQADMEAGGVTAEELDLAKNKVASQVVRRAERPMNRLFAIGNNWIQRGCYRTVRESVDSYLAVTQEDIARVLAKYPLTRTATVMAGPLEKPASV
jgi:predicted Zn-dependent peptidase